MKKAIKTICMAISVISFIALFGEVEHHQLLWTASCALICGITSRIALKGDATSNEA